MKASARVAIRHAATLPVHEFERRNDLLQYGWSHGFHRDYLLPTHQAHYLMDWHGMSTNTAVNWSDEIADHPLWEGMVTWLFRGGQGHCAPHPKGKFPVEVLHGIIHFYQSKAYPAQALRFFAGALRQVMTPAQWHQYWHSAGSAPPPQAGGVPSMFVSDFGAVVRTDRASLEEHTLVLQRRGVIRDALDEGELRKRAHLVANYVAS